MLRLPGNIAKLSIPQALATEIRNGVSEHELAREIGVSISALRSWVRGVYSPTIENINKVMTFFGFNGKQPAEWKSVSFEDADGVVYTMRARMIDMNAVQIAIESGSSATLIGRIVVDTECSAFDAGVTILSWVCDSKFNNRTRNPAALAISDAKLYILEIETDGSGKKKATLHGIGMTPMSVSPKKL